MCPNTNKKEKKKTWIVTETKQDASFIPTLAVTLWMGWLGGTTFLTIIAILTSNMFIRTSIIASMLVSCLLPRKYPESISYPFGCWVARNGWKYMGLKTIIEDIDAIKKYDTGTDADKALIFTQEPHDFLPYSVIAFHKSMHMLPGKIGIDGGAALITSAVFRVPFVRQSFSWTGCDPVDKHTFRKRLKEKKSFVFIPGGVQEVLLIDPKKPEEVVLYLKKRKGFVKLALEYGSPIVPVFSFNLDKSYGYFIIKGKLVESIARKIGFLPIFFWGRFGIPLGIPYPAKISLVIGKPMEVPKLSVDEITADVIDKYHGMFLDEMEALFERHKEEEGYGGRSLKIM